MRSKNNENHFIGQTIYVGIDYHLKNWKITIMGEEYEHKTFSQDPDPHVLYRYLCRMFPGATYKAVYEAGFSGFGACRTLRELGIDCIVVHAADVPTSQKEKYQKTDTIDSRKLARSLRDRQTKGVHIPEEQIEVDRALIRHRFRMVKDLSRIKNRVKSLLYQFGIKIPEAYKDGPSRYWSKAYTNWLIALSEEKKELREVIQSQVQLAEYYRKELLKINKTIRALSQNDYYINNYKLLLTIPGIGPITSMMFLTHLDNIERFQTLDKLCNFVGLVPSMYGSGDKMQMGKLIKRGRKILKVMLIEASWQAIRSDPAMMYKFNELIGKMQKNKAIIRIARKLLSRIRYVLKHQQEYEIGIIV